MSKSLNNSKNFTHPLFKKSGGFAQHHFQNKRLVSNFKPNKHKNGASRGLPLTFFSQKGEGFTLIESAVAIAVLMVGLWAVAQFFPFSLKVIGDSQNITVASNLVVAKIEEISSTDYDLISTGTIEAKAPISADPASYLNNYQREVVVELIDSNFNITVTDIGLKKITVTVYWISPIGKVEKSTNSVTVVSDI